MDLWIRSQDKEKLLKVNDIAIEMNMIFGYFDKNTEYEHLGTYATKERALEVLDEIQNIITLNTNFEIVSQNNKLLNQYIKQLEDEKYIDEYNSIKTVYKMPEE